VDPGALTRAVVEGADRLGIDACGVCRAEPYSRAEELIIERREAGLFADMRFTMAHPERSCHPETLLRGARSVVAAARSYTRPEPPKPDDRPRGRMPRYTRRDEYAVLREQLAELGTRLGEWAPGARSAVFVDANHHVDREAAARSGIAVYGKNTLAITRRHGSWVVLGVLVTDAELEPTNAAPDEPAWDACGSCRACIDACPTGAIVADGVLDARRCLSYHTQSRLDELPSAAELGDRVYGCDICQDVCPWNRKAPVTREAAFLPCVPYPGAERVILMSDDELRARFKGTALLRSKPAGLRRNATIARDNAARAGRASA
jgi:epoxyqueuosine reductase